MKRMHFCAIALVLVFVTNTYGQKHATWHTLAFQRYESYFEKNDSGLKGRTSYLVFTTQEQFDRIFHPATTMGQNNFLLENVFNSSIVIATIKRGRSLRWYKPSRITAENSVLYVWYTAWNSAPSGTATFNSPLILTVDKHNYSRVVFMENGKRVAVVSISK